MSRILHTLSTWLPLLSDVSKPYRRNIALKPQGLSGIQEPKFSESIKEQTFQEVKNKLVLLLKSRTFSCSALQAEIYS